MSDSTLEDAFAGLHIGDQSEYSYNDISESFQHTEFDVFQDYQSHPANSFERPIYYRVVHADSWNAESDDIQSKLHPPPSFQTLTVQQVRGYVNMHAVLSNRVPTPFISATIDLVRALHITFCTYKERTKVTILLICPWRLEPGSFMACNDLRAGCGLEPKSIYDTEVMIWGQVPSRAILYRWDREHVCRSGLLDVFPCIADLKVTTRLQDLRTKLKDDYPQFSAKKIASALLCLGMSPSELHIKQVFLFLLGQAVGYAVQKNLDKTDAHLRTLFPLHIDEFEDAIFHLATLRGRQSILSYFKKVYAKDVRQLCPQTDPFGILTDRKYQRRWRKSWSMRINDRFCPNFRSWWIRREETDLSELEMQEILDQDAHGLREWLISCST
ncbi:uncharacterized protein SETTUDRAFT_40212 [Exserohilum turcica Et28A]|uniref:DUF7587 domain-containing protein n=1 Tax=Exserohilum turcicum (strain 28A) TaxID=671987 RepID=R0IKE2_EXST2|nr:uncharacterized protein SETTUDRAFT_40212 [Exserohilum turcica Et28A]EOA85570.1 hypothetical protein SETTUDRAFT_40212 [Exserohilum turcica Et28A]